MILSNGIAARLDEESRAKTRTESGPEDRFFSSVLHKTNVADTDSECEADVPLGIQAITAHSVYL